MQLAFGWYNIIELLFCLVASVDRGIRDLQGKDPLIHLPFSTNMTATRNTAPCGRRKTACGRSSTAMVLADLRSFWATVPTAEQRGTHHSTSSSLM